MAFYFYYLQLKFYHVSRRKRCLHSYLIFSRQQGSYQGWYQRLWPHWPSCLACCSHQAWYPDCCHQRSFHPCWLHALHVLRKFINQMQFSCRFYWPHIYQYSMTLCTADILALWRWRTASLLSTEKLSPFPTNLILPRSSGVTVVLTMLLSPPASS